MPDGPERRSGRPSAKSSGVPLAATLPPGLTRTRRNTIGGGGVDVRDETPADGHPRRRARPSAAVKQHVADRKTDMRRIKIGVVLPLTEALMARRARLQAAYPLTGARLQTALMKPVYARFHALCASGGFEDKALMPLPGSAARITTTVSIAEHRFLTLKSRFDPEAILSRAALMAHLLHLTILDMEADGTIR